MSLPNSFQFSASSLQDYVDCPRRFQLRYLLQVAWPAPEVEPIEERERHGQLARDFHQLVHQHLLGLPIEDLSASVQDPDLERWWRAYLAYAPSLREYRAVPEITLSTPLAGHRVMAQFDVILIKEPARESEGAAGTPDFQSRSLLIIDWKTYRRRPSRTWLAQRLQTRVYPLVLVEAGASLLNRPLVRNKASTVCPDDVEMRYWMAEYPQALEIFTYDAVAYQADLHYLSNLIMEIAERARRAQPGSKVASAIPPDEIWPLTRDVHQCRYCNYRSLCERGDTAGPLAEYITDEDDWPSGESDLGSDLDWGQVQEIVY
jgi:hypothetical protein